MEIIVLLVIITVASFVIPWIFASSVNTIDAGDAIDAGNTGEYKVSRSLQVNLGKEYLFLNNVIIPDNVEGTTQIDHIILSPFGIFVV